jgi:hypothetical protein
MARGAYRHARAHRKWADEALAKGLRDVKIGWSMNLITLTSPMMFMPSHAIMSKVVITSSGDGMIVKGDPPTWMLAIVLQSTVACN